MDKKEVFFVIVNLSNLQFEDDGCDVTDIESAEKFDTLEDAKSSLEDYDDEFVGKIYRVNKRTYYDVQLESED